MKIMWLCNIMPVQIAKALKKPFRSTNGWINVLYEFLAKEAEIELTVLFPVDKCEQIIYDQIDGTNCISFFQDYKRPERYETEQKDYFKMILERVEPDVVHIWGSEYPHTLAMVYACAEKNWSSRVVISIQGLISVCARHYTAALPEKVIKGKTLRDFLKWDGVKESQKKFEKRGKLEIEALKRVNHVIGRTEWDFACVKQINPDIIYHKGNEILRESFYCGTWELETCEKHSIFLSQWGYPLKGMHMVLEALRDVVQEYPDAKLITTGKNPLKATGKEKIKQTYYERYLINLIKKWNLEAHVVFLGGEIQEEQMKDQYLKAHVFVLSSAVENSPNSMGEAMLLGTPVIASNVGGVSSLLTHDVEGFLYPFDEPYMLAYYIKRVFEENETARKFSDAGRKRAALTHHVLKNVASYYAIYKEIKQE